MDKKKVFFACKVTEPVNEKIEHNNTFWLITQRGNQISAKCNKQLVEQKFHDQNDAKTATNFQRQGC